MRGRLVFIAGGAALAVGAVALAATVAYAAPRPNSAVVLKSAALVVPANYHPSAASNDVVVPASAGLIAVAPKPARSLVGGSAAPVTPPKGAAAKDPGGPKPPKPPAGPKGAPTPPVPPAPPAPADGGPAASPPPATSGDDGGDNGKGKGKTNNGNDLNNKGTGSNKGKSKP